MKKYFISKENEKKGPFTIEEIKKMELTDEYSVWTEGFVDWEKITTIEELRGSVIITPPPTPKEIEKTKQKEAIISALKISVISLIALWLLIFFIMGGFMNAYNIKKLYGYGEYRVYGTPSQIREILATASLLFSTIISIIILFFTYRNELKK